jgi:hypothetical protein
VSFHSWLRSLRAALVPNRTGYKRRRSQTAAAARLRLEALDDRRLPSFSPATMYAAGTIPDAVLTADFNGDGRLDLAVANYGSSNVSVLLGNGNGTFQPAVNSPTGTWPVSLAVGDFDADGRLDLATANSASGDVSVLRGNGNGTFGAPTNLHLGGCPKSVAVGDFNADGKLDLGVTLDVAYGDEYGITFASNATVLLGNGDGTFAAPYAAPLGYGLHTPGAVADFNADGNLDLAAASADYWSVDVVFGDGRGAFGDPVAVWVGSAPYSVTAGDVNADGRVDLVTASAGNNVGVLLGTGLGSFGAAQNYPIGGSPYNANPYSVALVDFNGDGKVDVVTANEISGTVSVLLGAGNGSFGTAQHFAVGSEPQSLAVGDFNGDLFPDVAVANERSDDVSVLINDRAWLPLSAPTICVSDVTVTEGNTGTVGATFIVTLSAAYGQPVTVAYATADGNATPGGGDFQARSGTLTFGVGETSKTITVPVNGDRIGEYNEEFYLRLSNPINAFVSDETGVGTIVDDEPYAYISGKTTVTEGNTGTREAVFIVSLGTVSDADVTVRYSTAAGSAAAGSDYQAATGTVTIPAGQTSRTVRVRIIGDRTPEQTEYAYFDEYGYPYSQIENNEYFHVNISSSDARIGNSQGLGVIRDDEPRIDITDVTKKEGKKGQTTAFTFTVTLSAAYDQAVTMSFRTVDGTGTASTSDNDYVVKTGTLTFAPGETTKTITVEVKGDSKKEADEYFYLDLFNNSSNSLLARNRGFGQILNDD